MSDDKSYCKAISKIVKRHEAIDGHKIMSHSKSRERSKKFERTTTKIMNHHKNYVPSQKLWTNTKKFLLGLIIFVMVNTSLILINTH